MFNTAIQEKYSRVTYTCDIQLKNMKNKLWMKSETDTSDCQKSDIQEWDLRMRSWKALQQWYRIIISKIMFETGFETWYNNDTRDVFPIIVSENESRKRYPLNYYFRDCFPSRKRDPKIISRNVIQAWYLMDLGQSSKCLLGQLVAAPALSLWDLTTPTSVACCYNHP